MNKVLPVILLATLFLTSCNSLIGMLVGYKELTNFNEEDCTSFLKESQQTLPCSQIISTVDQTNARLSLDTAEAVFHDLYQPVHVLCFDGDSLVSWLVQCYATKPGSLKVDWNHDGHFNTFPPQSSVPIPFGHLSLTRHKAIYPTLQSTTRYTVLIIYTNMMRRVSLRAIEAMAHSLSGHEKESRRHAFPPQQPRQVSKKKHHINKKAYICNLNTNTIIYLTNCKTKEYVRNCRIHRGPGSLPHLD